MKAAGLLHMLCVVPFLAGFAFQAFAAIVPSVPSKSASRPEGPVEPDNHAMTPDAHHPVSTESSDRLTELQQQQPINYPMPEPPNEAAPFTLWLNSETGIDIRASNPFYPYALGKLVGSLYDIVFYWHASMYPDCGQNVVEHKKAFQQIWETQSSTGSDLRLVSWAVEAKIMDTIVQSVKARVDNQLNWLYGVVVTFIQLSPCNRNRDLRLYSDYLKTFIESELMASMPTCLKSANIELLSSSLVHEAEKTLFTMRPLGV
ncbi:hypothetical protein H4R34_005108 [Dimargaris verticillata]|uniref:Uncharacterized protein n=1 Tax=Dimargaris verticillata TaxID=2761393 RepID=A0A9W8AXJ0_9FUNG|nr:hypothetical protein H4R34_005108 [Dimargaris verticillata]